MATDELSKFAGILSAALSQHHLSGFEIAPLQKNAQDNGPIEDEMAGWHHRLDGGESE